MRSRRVERVHAAHAAEAVLGDVRVERVGREIFFTREQLERVLRHDEVKETLLLADGAVAIERLELRGVHAEADALAVTAPFEDVGRLRSHRLSRYLEGGSAVEPDSVYWIHGRERPSSSATPLHVCGVSRVRSG